MEWERGKEGDHHLYLPLYSRYICENKGTRGQALGRPFVLLFGRTTAQFQCDRWTNSSSPPFSPPPPSQAKTSRA